MWLSNVKSMNYSKDLIGICKKQIQLANKASLRDVKEQICLTKVKYLRLST